MAKLFRCTFAYKYGGQNMENVLYFKTDLSAEDLTADLHIHWAQVMAANQVNGVTWSSIKAIEVGHLLLDPEYYERPIADTGVGGNFHSDPQLAVCIGLHTGLSGRKRRGRWFFGGIADELVEDGKLTASGFTQVATMCTTLAGYYIGNSAHPELEVFSRSIFDGLTDIILDSYKPVTVMQPNVVMSTMRSRKPA